MDRDKHSSMQSQLKCDVAVTRETTVGKILLELDVSSNLRGGPSAWSVRATRACQRDLLKLSRMTAYIDSTPTREKMEGRIQEVVSLVLKSQKTKQKEQLHVPIACEQQVDWSSWASYFPKDHSQESYRSYRTASNVEYISH